MSTNFYLIKLSSICG